MTATDALAAVLDDLAAVVGSLSDTQYVDSAIPGVSGSVGSHVRHCLDHVGSLEQSLTTGVVNYDARERDALVEQDRMLARSLLVSARRRVASLPCDVLTRPVVVRTLMHARMPAVEVLSSLGREVSFVIAHTIHHCATIAVLAGVTADRLPQRFGLAPSTPSMPAAMRLACAR
ncbi:MAG TPA: hypothetical protein VF491_01500 [Vicinamibacterales bacterium]|jgi:hypothetical protein